MAVATSQARERERQRLSRVLTRNYGARSEMNEEEEEEAAAMAGHSAADGER